jgi:hypothetical protein
MSTGIFRDVNSIYKWFLHDEIIDDEMLSIKAQQCIKERFRLPFSSDMMHFLPFSFRQNSFESLAFPSQTH